MDAAWDAGITLFDTADAYGGGRSEKAIGAWLRGQPAEVRERIVVSSKVFHSVAGDPDDRGLGRDRILRQIEGSLERLGLDRLDLYLLHWRGRVPLEETLAAFQDLVTAGKIRYWGVSNFDVADMVELTDLPGGGAVATNQVLYNLARRGIEEDLLPWCQARHLPVMAYTPIQQDRLLGHSVLRAVAARHQSTPAQVALAWVLRQDGVNVIPKAGTAAHVRENRAALDLRLDAADLAELDHAFPPPAGPGRRGGGGG
jgi:aryl-alcohol dehydrogenase-like predicted oxidoreductase